MSLLARCTLSLAFMLAMAQPVSASMAEKTALNSAKLAFQTALWDRAEAAFAEFVQNFPTSADVPEAILLQAQARLQQGNHKGAMDLLSAGSKNAGKWADQYAFWLAQAQLQKGDFRPAADSFAKLVADFPQSNLRLEATIGQATGLARLKEWPKIIELLQKPEGVFKSAVATNAADEAVPRGYLLLGEAQLAQNDYRGAEATLELIRKRLLSPKLAWEWQYLMCRIQVADGKREEALASTTNLISNANNAAQPGLLAESIAFKAQLLESMLRVDQSIETSKENLSATTPAEHQRKALLKITDLYLAQNRINEAAAALEKFVAQHPNAASTDLALLSVGQLRLHQYLMAAESNRVLTNDPPPTNSLPLARSSFENLIKTFTQSPLLGKANLNLGWCLWLQGLMPDAQKAFLTASQVLPASADQATAFFKLADCQFQQQDFSGAITNYRALITKLEPVPEVKTNLMEQALYQIVRASLAAGDLASASNSMQLILASFPNSFHAERALLLTGQEISRKGNPEEARRLFVDFAAKAPQAELLPEVQLAVARTYEQQNKWAEAIEQYDRWVGTYPTNAARPRAEYYRALANYQAGRETNALTQFTNLVAQFPTSEFAPNAQWWVADYYFHAGNSEAAEIAYQSLWKTTNWPVSIYTYEAQMMAGRVAVKRQGWKDALSYFLNLSTNANCPEDLVVQALFAYGDTLMSAPSAETNKLANYREAILVFQNLCERFPTNKLAVLASGEMANCYLQWAQNSRPFEPDTNILFGFQKVIASPLADAKARSVASVGIAILFEKQAEQTNGPVRNDLLEKAFNRYLDVFHGTILREREEPDAFWMRKAGLEAGRLAEALEKWLPAKQIYQQLRDVLPVYRARLDKNLLRVQEHLPANP